MARMPALYISHGAPTYALAPGVAGAQLTALGRSLPRAKAVLVVSPHWTTRDVQVGAVARPTTIHDFGGFDPALYQLDYPARGSPAFAALTRDLLNAKGWNATLDERRGLDHGAWVPLRHLLPEANVPVFQVSMPEWLDASSAWRYGEALAGLADESVLIVGSGSLTHNLYDFRSANGISPNYAKEFVAWVREAVTAGDRERLLKALELAPHAQRAHPTPEHFLPLLIAAGASGTQGRVEVLDGGFTFGVLSMESYVFGARGIDGALPESSHA